MRLRHFEELAPICPRCRTGGRGEVPIVLATIERRIGDDVLEGILHCQEPVCRQEYPIVDGIPIIVPDVAKYLGDFLWHVNARDDLSAPLETLLGDAAGPGSAFDTTRFHISSYVHDHWGEFDPREAPSAYPSGAMGRCLSAGLDLLGSAGPDGPTLDIGCSVGRSSMTLAGRRTGLALGTDPNFSTLRVARRALTTGEVVYARRRIGLVYDRRRFAVPVDNPEQVDFWACDAMAMPFAAKHFATVAAMNVLDCVPDPRGLLMAIGALLMADGGAVLATPYDWSTQATLPLGWIGGHSQRGAMEGAAEPQLRALLAAEASQTGLRLVGEVTDFPWHVRLHDRSTVVYSGHLMGVRAV